MHRNMPKSESRFEAWMAVAVLLVTLVAGSVSAQSPKPAGKAQTAVEMRHTVVAWLECGECEDGELEAVVALGEAIVPSLEASLERGPSAASHELLRRHLISTYQDLETYAQTHPEAKLPLSESDYVDLYLESFEALYQMRAAEALAAVGGKRAEKALWEAVKQPTARADVDAAIRQAFEKL